jgi:hypothetical protein
MGMMPIDEKNVDTKNITIFIHEYTRHDEGEKCPTNPMER